MTQQIVLRPEWLIDGVSGRPQTGLEVRVVDGVIAQVTAVGSSGTDDVRVVDLSGHTLLPGLIDCHTHYPLDGEIEAGNSVELSQWEASESLMLVAARNARKAVESGVTTARGAGAPRGLDIFLAAGIERGDVAGPRLLPAGGAVTITGGHGMHFGVQADSITEMVKAVRSQVALGAQVIKAIASEAAQRTDAVAGVPEMTTEELAAIVTEAARVKRRVLAHAQDSESVKAAALAGVASVEHAFLADDEAIGVLAETGVALCPTLVVTDISAGLGNMSPEQVERHEHLLATHRQSASTAIKLNVPIITGTDCGVRGITSDLVWREVAILVELGMSPVEAIRSATSLAAEVVGVDHLVGSVEVGKRADLVAVSGDLTSRIEALAEPVLVLKDGHVVVDHGPERNGGTGIG